MIKASMIALATFLTIFFAGGSMVSAQGAACTPAPGPGGDILGFPTWYKYLSGETDSTGKCSIKFDIAQDAGKIILAVIEIMLRISALVAVGFIMYGGFRYILSQGNPDAATSARKTIINSVIGLVIAILATAIVNLVARSLG